MNFEATAKNKEIQKYALLIFSILVLAVIVYYRVTINELNLVTGLLFLAAVSLLIFLVAKTVLSLLKGSKKTKNNIRLLLITVGVLLIGLELFFRFGLNRYSTYIERNGSLNYESLYEAGIPSWFSIYDKNQDIRWVRAEFIHTRKTNSLGLAEGEIDVEKGQNEFRIIALGDSFTEGMGTSYNYTWVKVVERNLTDLFPNEKIITINAGIAGSDVFFSYILLKEKLLPFKPDLLIIAINHSDVYDVVIMGGMERFQDDDSTVFSGKAPSWEWAYAISYIFRHMIHDIFQYNYFFIKNRVMESEERKAVEKIRSVIYDFKRLSQENSFDLLVVIHPVNWEIKYGGYLLSFNPLIIELKNEQGISLIDLLDYYKVNNLITKENSSDYFWRIDLHHNTKGYEVMGNAITNKIVELDLLIPIEERNASP